MTKKHTSTTLAPVQRQTLDFLRQFIAEHGMAPSLKEIAAAIGVKSLSTAHFHLERLESKGFIRRREDGRLDIIEPDQLELGPTSVPLLGLIAAGRPIEAVERSTMIDVPPSMIDSRGEVYCLQVTGNSMIDAHICDGDVVVIKKQADAEDGQIVVAILPDGGATLKRYRKLKGGKVMLLPENKDMQPITADNVEIRGRLVGVIRELH
jgi:repressor LexA